MHIVIAIEYHRDHKVPLESNDCIISIHIMIVTEVLAYY